MEGIIAGESAICQVDPNAGLLYRGYDVEALANQSSFEEIVWLLLYGDLPSCAQYEEMREQLAAERHLPDAVLALLATLIRDINMMDMLRTSVSLLAAYDPDLNDHSHDANVRKAIRLIAKTSTLVTTGWRLLHHQHPYGPGADLTHAARFLESLWEKPPEPWQTSILDTVFVLYAEHEFNASTFAARVTASTMADMYAAVTSAIGTLKGPLHGGANEESIKMLQEIGTPEGAEPWLMERLAKKEKIMGFGHRVYRTGDSRVPVMRRWPASWASVAVSHSGSLSAKPSKPSWCAKRTCMPMSISTPPQSCTF